MPRLIDLKVTRYDWIPLAAGLTTPLAPKTTELALAKPLSAYTVATTKVGAVASDTVSEKSIIDTANVAVPTVGNYEGNLVLFRDFTAGVATADDPLTIIGATAGIVGWIIKRVGLDASTAYAVGQKIECYLFTTDSPQVTGGESDGYLKVTFPLLAAGTFSQNVTTVA